MNCSCGSDYFASSVITQTAKDGRAMNLCNDPRFPWVAHLTCVDCGKRYVYPDRMRSGGRLIEAGTAEAKSFLEEDRQDFSKSFDKREYPDATV